MINDFGHEDRRQLLMHTKMTPLVSELLREEWTRERDCLELAIWSLFLGFCGALVAIVILLAELGVID